VFVCGSHTKVGKQSELEKAAKGQNSIVTNMVLGVRKINIFFATMNFTDITIAIAKPKLRQMFAYISKNHRKMNKHKHC
jgi:predicted hotdog family 3-hydroxylacyl-ACP dehydratase